MKKLLIILFAFSTLGIISCEREWDNPWDKNSTLDPDAWAPYELKVLGTNSFNEVTIHWKAPELNYEGFMVKRQIITHNVSNPWEKIADIKLNPNNYEYVDLNDKLSLQNNDIAYRIWSYAGNMRSTEQTIYVELPRITTDEVVPVENNSNYDSLFLNGTLKRWGSGENANNRSYGFIRSKSFDSMTLEDNTNEIYEYNEPLSAEESFYDEISIDEFTADTTYYFRSFAKTTHGVGYGDIVSIMVQRCNESQILTGIKIGGIK